MSRIQLAGKVTGFLSKLKVLPNSRGKDQVSPNGSEPRVRNSIDELLSRTESRLEATLVMAFLLMP